MRAQFWLLATIGMLALVACEREAPSPWKEMKFPIRNGEILSGASDQSMAVLFRSTQRRADLYREFQRSLERAGYKHDRDGKEHDPPGDTHSGVFKQGAAEILLTVTAAPGGADARVQVQMLD